MQDKIWGMMVHLSGDFSGGNYKKWMATPLNEYFDEDMWHSLVDRAKEAGMNTIVMEVIDGVKYYCDVGFGGPGPKGLVPLNTEEEQIFDGMRYRVRVEGIYVKIEWFHDDEWHLQISYADIPCIPEDFQARLYFFTTAPDSHFVVQRIVNLCLPCGGSLALTGNQFTARRNGEVTQVVLETEEEVTRVLKEEFGIVL